MDENGEGGREWIGLNTFGKENFKSIFGQASNQSGIYQNLLYEIGSRGFVKWVDRVC